MDSLQERSKDHGALRLRRQSRLQASLGVVGLGGASLLLAPKVALLLGGNLDAVGLGLIANLALAFGSLMLLRNAHQLRQQRKSQPRPNEKL
jgi:hypothetical protein